jgi:hypothetical protein
VRGRVGVRERVGTEGMVEDIGGARQQESHGIGQEGGCRGAVTGEVILHCLDVVFALPPGAVEFFIDLRRRRRLKGGDNEAWIVASGHDFGFDNDPPGLGPGRGSIGERGIHTAAERRARAMRLGVGGPLLLEPACFLPDGRRLTEQDGIASQAEDKIDSTAMGQPLAPLGGGKMAVATDKDRGLGPVPPQHGEETHQDHGIFSPRGACARAQAGGDQGV